MSEREKTADEVCTDGYCATCGAIALCGADYCENHEPLPGDAMSEQEPEELLRRAHPSNDTHGVATEPRPSVGEAREQLNTQLRCMADEIRAWGTVVEAQVDSAIDTLITASALTERFRLAHLNDDVDEGGDGRSV